MTDRVHIVHDEHGGGVARVPSTVLDHFTDKGWKQVEVDDDGNVVKQTGRASKKES